MSASSRTRRSTSTSISSFLGGSLALALVVGLVAAGSPSPADAADSPSEPSYSVDDGLRLDSWPGTVAVSPDGQSVYVTEGGSSLAIVDAASKAVDATIPIPEGAGLVAVSPDGTHAYVAGYSALSVVDLAARTVTASIGVPERVWAMVLSPDGSRAYLSSRGPYASVDGDGSVAVVDLQSETLAATIPVQIDPAGIAVSRDGGTVYVANDDPSGGSVSVIDTSTETVTRSFAAGTYPTDVAVSADGATAYVTDGDGNRVFVIDAATGDVIATIDDNRAPAGVTLSPDGAFAYVANSGQGLTVIDTATNALFASVDSVPGISKVAVSPNGSKIYTTDSISSMWTISLDPAVSRVAGADRYATSVQVSQHEFPGTAPVVYVASGLEYPDALSAGPVAVKMGGPVLLTAPGSLPSSVAAEVTRLQPSTIVVAGGEGAVSDSVLDQLEKAVPSATVSRVSGLDRYATSRAMVESQFSAASTIYLATGSDYPDALAAGAAAGHEGLPVLLVDGAASTVDASTAALLRRLNVANIVIAGGAGSISAKLAADLEQYGSVKRLSGADRYGTTEAIDEHAYASAKNVLLASGMNFPDALSAAAWSGASASPLYLVRQGCVPQKVLTDIQNLSATSVTLIGGSGVLTVPLESLTGCAG